MLSDANRMGIEMKAFAVALAGVLLCAPVFAEDGLVVHFTIKKTFGTETKTYTNTVLMRLSEVSTFTFPGLYEMRLDSRATHEGEENLVIALKDVSSGKPVYAGSGAATLRVGEHVTVPLHQLHNAEARYQVFLDTSYGQLPNSVH